MKTMRTPLASLLAVLALGIFATPAFAQELCYDGLDNDSDPATADDDELKCVKVDADTDGYWKFVKSGGTDVADCDDTDATIHPGATEIAGNNVDENCDGIKAPGPAAAATATTSGACPAGQSCQPDASAKKALAKRWGATYDATNDAITCVVPADNPVGAGSNCWSVDFEKSGVWNWNVDPASDADDKAEHAPAPYRWSVTSQSFVSKGTFVAIDRSHGITEVQGQIEELKAELALKASSADVTLLQAAVAQAQADLAAYVTSNDGELDVIRAGLADVQALLPRVTVLETASADHETRITALEESDLKQNKALAYLLRNARIYFDAHVGYLLMAGDSVTSDVGGEDFPHRYGVAHLIEIGGTIGLQDQDTGHGLQLTYGFGWGEDTDGLGINHNVVLGPMFRLADGVSLGIRGGLNVNEAGIRDGSNLSSSTGGVIAFSGMVTGPLDALPGFRWDVGATIDSVRYDDLTDKDRQTVPRLFLRLGGRWGSSVKASPIDASEFDD